ncbi:hypothetical protein SAY86_012008 [Trapa natans]|uniref:Small ribosomal subunit protein bS18c n=1 Tax=Trapa natans TaxID=22666 RepID=A0AAN7R6M4_TRANT|nr:hypothetical protein SAY86_012008 [Trapa natans]
MRLAQAIFRSFGCGISCQCLRVPVVRQFSVTANLDHGNADYPNSGSFESGDDFERRIFGDSSGSSSRTDAFLRRFDHLQQGRSGSRLGNEDDSGAWGSVDFIHDTLDDGMDNKLKREATYFEYDSEECDEEDYSFRPDMNFQPGTTYDVKDLDLRRPGVWKPSERREFEVTTEEVLKKADFRNVRFLANFITEAGIIIKRNKTGISAKAQRKIAREIKTARAFGLIPFTTMGTKSFVYGKSMQNLDKDYEYEVHDSPVDDAFDAPNARRGML